MKKNIILFLSIVVLVIVSCTKVLDQAPKGALSGEVLLSKEGAEALVIACYSALDNKDPQPAWGWGNVGSNLLNNPSMWESGDLRAGDCYKGGGGTDDVAEYGNIELGIVQATNGALPVIWKSYYVSVSRCNKALQVLNKLTDEQFDLRTRRIGEVKVLRGFTT